MTEDFELYLEKYAINRGISKEEALKHKQVHHYYEYLKDRDRDLIKEEDHELLKDMKEVKGE